MTDQQEANQPQNESFANPEVLEFYRTLPFNYRDSIDDHVSAIRDNSVLSTYAPLLPLLKGRARKRVLEVGCSVGWLSMGMAHHHNASVRAIDFNPVVIERAQAINETMALDVAFEVADLFTYEPNETFDVVASMGVRHHTDNCLAAVHRLCSDFVAPDGHVMIGLYHEPGHRPFLDHFAHMQQQGASESEMMAEYARLHSWLSDPLHIKSWFRDQVLHPHETQHTLQEMMSVLAATKMRLTATSINRFQPLPKDVASLFSMEQDLAELSHQRLAEGSYYPGFFVFFAQKDKNHFEE